MRTLLTISLLAILVVACKDDDKELKAKRMSDPTTYTTIQWLDSIVHFDTITMGEKATVKFRFKNTGDKPLFITEARAGCGCTIPDYTKGAIAPGQGGEVTGAFDSKKAHAGIVRKSIFVTTNTQYETEHTLIFTGIINEAPVIKR
jgi:hypothetical protein